MPEDSTPPSSITDLPDATISSLLSIAKGSDSEAKELLKRALGYEPTKAARRRLSREGQPYYQEVYAKEMIPVLESIAKDKKSKKLLMKDYPQYKINTLYARVSQSINFILDNMDKEGKYRKIRESFRLERKRDRIIFEYIASMPMDEKLTFHEHSNTSSYEEVRAIVEKFIEEGLAGEKLHIPFEENESGEEFLPFRLSAEEKIEIEALCRECESMGMVNRITEDEIFLAKVKTV
jgi:hypothetical protein